MPLLKPKDKETREDFMGRCMSDDKTTNEFPTTEQRLAVCNSQYKNKTKEKYSMNDSSMVFDISGIAFLLSYYTTYFLICKS